MVALRQLSEQKQINVTLRAVIKRLKQNKAAKALTKRA